MADSSDSSQLYSVMPIRTDRISFITCHLTIYILYNQVVTCENPADLKMKNTNNTDDYYNVQG